MVPFSLDLGTASPFFSFSVILGHFAFRALNFSVFRRTFALASLSPVLPDSLTEPPYPSVGGYLGF